MTHSPEMQINTDTIAFRRAEKKAWKMLRSPETLEQFVRAELLAAQILAARRFKRKMRDARKAGVIA